MRKNGFTLIELLAVIVILAIIAIIAVPIVLNIIEDTKNSALLRSADFYLDAVELAIAEKVLDGGTIDGEYTINSNGNICKNEECIEVEVQGQKPTSGKIIIEDGKIKSIYKLLLGGKTISTDSNGNLAIKKYNTYRVTYENINNTSNLPTTVEEGDNAVIDLTGKNITSEKLTVKINNELTTNYTYENYILTIPNVNGNIEIIGGEKYIVSYTNIENTTNLPTTVIEGSTLEIDLENKEVTSFKVYMNEEEVTNYIYENNILTIPNVTGNVVVRKLNTYTVTYQNIDDVSGLPTTVVEENALIVNLTDKGLSEEEITVKVNNEEISDYRYTNYVLTVEDISGNVIVKGYKKYTVTYTNISNTTGLPTSVLEGSTLEVKFASIISSSLLQVKVNNEIITDYTYNLAKRLLTISEVSGNVEIIKLLRNFSVVYSGIEDTTNLPTTAIEGSTLEVDLSGKNISADELQVKKGSTITTDYTYENNKLIISNVTGNIEIMKVYAVTYEFLDPNDAKDLTSTVTAGTTLTVDLKNKSILDSSIIVKVNGEVINNYTYTNYKLTVPNVSGNVVITGALPQFSTDSWETIIANIKSGNTDAYNVGDKKKITLTSTDENVAGTYVVRLANKTINDDDGVCTNETYSQTACGYVIEFVDIITLRAMNSTETTAGGWPASEMRKFVTPVDGVSGSGVIYNALPEEVRTAIIDTRVVSGYEYGKSANYTSTDKLYLLSTKEVGTARSSDKVSSETRQLDYYSSSEIKYLDGVAKGWWMRSAYYNDTKTFSLIDAIGTPCFYSANIIYYGVAPAFRLG